MAARSLRHAFGDLTQCPHEFLWLIRKALAAEHSNKREKRAMLDEPILTPPMCRAGIKVISLEGQEEAKVSDWYSPRMGREGEMPGTEE